MQRLLHEAQPHVVQGRFVRLNQALARDLSLVVTDNYGPMDPESAPNHDQLTDT